MSPNNKSWKLSNLYTPKYSKDFKFTELADLPSIHCKSQQEEEKSSETVAVPWGICDSVKKTPNHIGCLSQL